MRNEHKKRQSIKPPDITAPPPPAAQTAANRIVENEHDWPSREQHRVHYPLDLSTRKALYDSFYTRAVIYNPDRSEQRAEAQNESAMMEQSVKQKALSNAQMDQWMSAMNRRLQKADASKFFIPRPNQRIVAYLHVISKASEVESYFFNPGVPPEMQQEILDIAELKALFGSVPENGRSLRLTVKPQYQNILGEPMTQINIQGIGNSRVNNQGGFTFSPPNTLIHLRTFGLKIIDSGDLPLLAFAMLEDKVFGGFSLAEAMQKHDNQELLRKRLRATGHQASEIIPLAAGVMKLTDQFLGEPRAIFVYFDLGEHRLRPFWEYMSYIIHYKNEPDTISRITKDLSKRLQTDFPYVLNDLPKAVAHLKRVYRKAGANMRIIHDAGMAGLDLQGGNIGGGVPNASATFTGEGVLYDLGGMIDLFDQKNESIFFLQMLADLGAFLRGIMCEFYDRIVPTNISGQAIYDVVFTAQETNFYREALLGYAGTDFDSQFIENLALQCSRCTAKHLSEDLALIKAIVLPDYAQGSMARKIIAIKQAQKYGMAATIPSHKVEENKLFIKNDMLKGFTLIEFFLEMMSLMYPVVAHVAQQNQVNKILSAEQAERCIQDLLKSYPYQIGRLISERRQRQAEGTIFHD